MAENYTQYVNKRKKCTAITNSFPVKYVQHKKHQVHCCVQSFWKLALHSISFHLHEKTNHRLPFISEN